MEFLLPVRTIVNNVPLVVQQWQRAEKWGICPQAPAEERECAERGCGNFLRHKIYKNSVSSVEAEINTEGQIMCVEQCTF